MKIALLFFASGLALGCIPTQNKFGWKSEDYFTDPDVCRLCRSIENHDLEKMKQLIDKGVNVNARGVDGMTPLMWSFVENIASRSGDARTFELLINSGADATLKIECDFGTRGKIPVGSTIAHIAASSVNSKYFRAILSKGIDPDIETNPENLRESRNLFESVYGDYLLDGTKDKFTEALIALHPSQATLDRAVEHAIRSGEFGCALSLFKAGANHQTISDWGTMVHLVVAHKSFRHPFVRKQHMELLERLNSKDIDLNAAEKDVLRWEKAIPDDFNRSRKYWTRIAELRERAKSELSPSYSVKFWPRYEERAKNENKTFE
jgi:hypothetical protein